MRRNEAATRRRQNVKKRLVFLKMARVVNGVVSRFSCSVKSGREVGIRRTGNIKNASV